MPAEGGQHADVVGLGAWEESCEHFTQGDKVRGVGVDEMLADRLPEQRGTAALLAAVGTRLTLSPRAVLAAGAFEEQGAVAIDGIKAA